MGEEGMQPLISERQTSEISEVCSQKVMEMGFLGPGLSEDLCAKL